MPAGPYTTASRGDPGLDGVVEQASEHGQLALPADHPARMSRSGPASMAP